MRAAVRRLGSASISRRRNMFTRLYCIDKDIQEFNKELESVFGAAPCNDFHRFSSDSSHQEFVVETPRDETENRVLAGNASVYGKVDEEFKLTHVDTCGKASMVDVSAKPDSLRKATASGRVVLGCEVFKLVVANAIEKGDVLTVAKIAGIQGAKQTSNLIPLCHNIGLSKVKVELELDEKESSVEVRAEASSVGATGVEMEALTAVSVACLTVYDMCKAVSKSIKIQGIQLESKEGGKSGSWCRTTSSVF